jgi:magnesium transporter
VDKENCLVGIITIDDIVDIIEQENTEDFHKMAAIAPSEDEYTKTPVIQLVKNRVVWLLVLMISAAFTGAIINHFESVLSTAVILASFIPMLMNTGGNAGTQTSTMCIRSIALGEIEFRDIFKVMWLEFRVSILVGFILSSINFLRIMLFTKTKDEPVIMVAIVVSISLYAVVILSKLLGAIMPLLAKKIKLDPAVMSTSVITTIVDAMSLTLFFTLSTILLHI